MSEPHGISRVAIPSSEQVAKEATEIIAEFFQRPEDSLKPSDDLYNDLGADSLDIIELTMEIEEHFDITVPDENTENTHTIGDIIEGICRLLENQRANIA
jgi:acyl carrier protein